MYYSIKDKNKRNIEINQVTSLFIATHTYNVKTGLAIFITIKKKIKE
jgi:hypothetical protein